MQKKLLETWEILTKLKTKKDKYEALKNNINVCINGYGLHQYCSYWIKNKNQVPLPNSSEHLKDIIQK